MRFTRYISYRAFNQIRHTKEEQMGKRTFRLYAVGRYKNSFRENCSLVYNC